jgi:hypothetical protein
MSSTSFNVQRPHGFGQPPAIFQQLRKDFQAAGIDPRAIAAKLAGNNNGQMSPDLMKEAIRNAIANVENATLRQQLQSDIEQVEALGPPPFPPRGFQGGPGHNGPGFLGFPPPELRQKIDNAFSQYGLNPLEVMQQVRQANGGQRPTSIEEAQNTFKLVLQQNGLNDTQITSFLGQLPPPPGGLGQGFHA